MWKSLRKIFARIFPHQQIVYVPSTDRKTNTLKSNVFLTFCVPTTLDFVVFAEVVRSKKTSTINETQILVSSTMTILWQIMANLWQSMANLCQIMAILWQNYIKHGSANFDFF